MSGKISGKEAGKWIFPQLNTKTWVETNSKTWVVEMDDSIHNISSFNDPEKKELIEALIRAIPESEIELLSNKHGIDLQKYRYKDRVIALYNDTREDQQEIVDWYERALIGIRTTKKNTRM